MTSGTLSGCCRHRSPSTITGRDDRFSNAATDRRVSQTAMLQLRQPKQAVPEMNTMCGGAVGNVIRCRSSLRRTFLSPARVSSLAQHRSGGRQRTKHRDRCVRLCTSEPIAAVTESSRTEQVALRANSPARPATAAAPRLPVRRAQARVCPSVQSATRPRPQAPRRVLACSRVKPDQTSALQI
jgi:hypothetical protein